VILVLEIVGEHAGAFGADGRKVFKACGGVVGRLPDSDWMLRDEYISARHAVIHYADEQFVIQDTSANGVYVNSEPEPIGAGESRAITTGDVLRLDRFEVLVTVLDDEGLGADRTATA
jgi:type VI secretion system protein ImpI/type VI secretion system protein